MIFPFSQSTRLLGGIIIPIIFRQLISKLGFGWTTRVIGFILLLASLIPTLGMKQLHRPKAIRDLLNTDIFKDAPYLLFCVAILLAYMGIYIVLFYVELYAIQRSSTTRELASYVIVIANAGSLIGRLALSLLADRWGPLNVQIPLATCTGVLALCWIGIENTTGLIVFAVLYGACSGAILTLAGPIVAELTTDIRTLGTKLGWFGFGDGVGMLIGSPLAGLFFRSQSGWIGLQVFSGVLLLLSTTMIVVVKFLTVRGRTTSQDRKTDPRRS